MPLGNGKGPPWGTGPGTGQRRGRCSGGKGIGNENQSQNLIRIIGSVITLVSSIVKLFSSKKNKEERR